jgi:membrane protein DedA with SNARE-associated domain
MDWLESVLIVGIIFFALLFLVKIVSDNRIRRKLIESGAVGENAKYLYAERMQHNIPSSLKWGMVLIGIGLAFLIGQLVPDLSGEITIACMFIFAGVGLLLFYFIAKKNESQETKK